MENRMWFVSSRYESKEAARVDRDNHWRAAKARGSKVKRGKSANQIIDGTWATVYTLEEETKEV